MSDQQTIVINTDANTFVGRFDSVEAAEAAFGSAKFDTYFVGEPQQLERFSIAELTAIYNSTREDPEDHLKAFKQKGVALDRVWSAVLNGQPQVARTVQRSTKNDADAAMFIRPLTADNPRRKTTGNGYKNWTLYEAGMLVADYLKAREDRDDIGGTRREHFDWDLSKGLVELHATQEAALEPLPEPEPE